MIRSRANLVFIFFMLLLAFMTACEKEDIISSLKEADLSVYTTIYPIQFIVETVGGDTVAVETVYPPGVDAHTFEPTSKDMTEIAVSDLFIYFGPTMEGFVESAHDALQSEHVTLVSLEKYPEIFHLNEQNGMGDISNKEINAHQTEGNPHVWIDPLRMITMVEIITEQLIEHNPEATDLYKRNRDELIVRLQKLDDLYKETLLQKEHKYMIVSHAAFSYWEERYGIEQIAISGLSPSEEPSQKYLTEIIQLAIDYDINYVFQEQNTPDKLIDIIQEQLNAETVSIHNLSVLTENDLEFGEDYFTLMEYNLNVLNEVFQ